MTAAEVHRWAWQAPHEIEAGRDPQAPWWSRFGAQGLERAAAMLAEYPDWRIIVVLANGQRVTFKAKGPSLGR